MFNIVWPNSRRFQRHSTRQWKKSSHQTRPGVCHLEERTLLFGGAWQQVTSLPAGFVAGPVFLLTNGNVLIQNLDADTWMELQPSSSGSYVDGTLPSKLVSTLPPDALGFSGPRAYDGTVLRNGDIFILGGEYANGSKPYINSGWIFDPTAVNPTTGNLGTWTLTKPVPIIWDGEPIVGDNPLSTLPGGDVIAGNNNGPAVYVGGDLGELSAATTAIATTIQFENPLYAPFPTHPVAPFSIEIEQEIMTVTKISANGKTWTVERGQDGTRAIRHADGASVDFVTTLSAPVTSATSTTIQVPASVGLPSPSPTTLSAAVTNSTATTITVASKEGFPLQKPLIPFPIQVGQEMMTVTSIRGTTLTVIRGTDGTAAVSHPMGTTVIVPYFIQLGQEIMEVTGASSSGNTITLTVERGAMDTTAVAHDNGAVVHLSSDYAETLIFDPTYGDWTTLPVTADKLQNDSAFEESWVKIPGAAGKILTYNNNAVFEYNVSEGQYYNPATKTWTATGTVPVILANNSFSNETGPALQLPGGDIFQLGGNGQSAIYHPTSNTWTAGPRVTQPLTTLARRITSDTATTIRVASTTTVPAAPFFISVGQEIMEVTNVSGTTWTVERAQFFTSAATHPRSASVSQLFVPGDQPAAGLPNGDIIFDASAVLETAPSAFFLYNPATNSISALGTVGMPQALKTSLQNSYDYLTSLLMLPTGQMLFSDGADNHLYIYTPSSAAPAPSSLPTISKVVSTGNGNRTFTLTGTQLTGISEGAFYGEDEGLSENYPLVRLTATNGNVFYARTFDWSTTAVATGKSVETTEFVLPSGIPAGTYRLTVVAAGISSASVRFTVNTT
jgi:hypothetical protein